ncbi:MAG: hypothetical protein EON98_12860 [Chitinophagaceae bacterium]|nr:MAG: hypothetical protein EON98_12860 [Chitinophagaceae bacterium]
MQHIFLPQAAFKDRPKIFRTIVTALVVFAVTQIGFSLFSQFQNLAGDNRSANHNKTMNSSAKTMGAVFTSYRR